jgi:ribosome modulation factor
MSTTRPCPGGCDHTDAEHRAFDRGLAAGSAGAEQSTCPYRNPPLVEDWLSGHSAGVSAATAKRRARVLEEARGDALAFFDR